MLKIDSAYKQLADYERKFVDGFVNVLDVRNAEYPLERITATLERVWAATDLETLDRRARAQFEKPLVRAAIRERVEALASERDLTAERILQEHAAIAFANMKDYVRVGTNGIAVMDMSEVTNEQWRAVQEVEHIEEFGRGGSKIRTKIKLYNKQTSLAELSKFVGINQPDSEAFVKYNSSSTVGVGSDETLEAEYALMIDG